MNIFHAPVLDLSIVVRVFSWGYILFGNEIGLSWAWVLKFIAMFIIYFELGMIITKKDKVLAVMLAVWLTFFTSNNVVVNARYNSFCNGNSSII